MHTTARVGSSFWSFAQLNTMSVPCTNPICLRRVTFCSNLVADRRELQNKYDNVKRENSELRESLGQSIAMTPESSACSSCSEFMKITKQNQETFKKTIETYQESQEAITGAHILQIDQLFGQCKALEEELKNQNQVNRINLKQINSLYQVLLRKLIYAGREQVAS